MNPGDTGALLRLQTEVLEAVACGTGLAVVADLLCRRAEALAPGVICSILTVDADGTLHPLAGPSLPSSYSSAIDCLQMGPKAGSCGTAAFRREPVVVCEIDTDPLWADFRHLTQPLGLRACWSSPILDQDGQPVATFAFYYRTSRAPDDIERSIVQTCVHLCAIAIENDQVRERNHRLAYFDALTGLPNRGHFNGLLATSIARRERFGLLLVDIDHLKAVNDTVGHGFGDMLIRTIAERIAGSDPRLTACRLGGDEFAVLVADCRDAMDLGEAATAMLTAVRGPIKAGDQTLDPHITVGGALFGDDGADGASLCQNADFALYHAKEVRRGGYVRFSPDLRTSMLERVRMVRNLDQAMLEGRILPYYQPVVRLDTSEIIGVEALARMRMPDGRIAEASEFHAGLSDPRIAYQMTGQMLEQIARDVRSWLDLGMDFQHVGINVTTGDFQRGDLEQRIVDAFARTGVPLKHVVLEVNEAVYMSGIDQRVPKAVGALRQHGLLVALDDFGTGFASLTHLLSFPVDIIKIDRSFVNRLGDDRAGDVLVGAIIDIARKLDMRVVAEGIETPAQAALLDAFGCTLGQGYLFSRPASFEETTGLLRLFAQKQGPAAVQPRRSA